MNTLPRSSLVVSGSILGLCVLGTIGFVSAWANQDSTAQVLAQGTGGLAGGQGLGGGMQPGLEKPTELVVNWEKPDAPTPSWLDAKNDVNEIEDRIQHVLNEPMELDFDDLALSSVIKLIRGKFDIAIVFDVRALEDENITPDERVSHEGSATKLCDVLTQILRPLELTYDIELERLVITSIKSIPNRLKFYDLSYILPDNGRISELISAIETMVTPDQWPCVGGASSMSTVGSMLLVSAPKDTHLELERLLRAISKQAPANLKSSGR